MLEKIAILLNLFSYLIIIILTATIFEIARRIRKIKRGR